MTRLRESRVRHWRRDACGSRRFPWREHARRAFNIERFGLDGTISYRDWGNLQCLEFNPDPGFRHLSPAGDVAYCRAQHGDYHVTIGWRSTNV